MKHIQISTAFLAGMMLAATPALAVTATNRNKGEQTVTVDRGEAQADQKLAVGASTEIECKEDCELRGRGSGYGRSVDSGDRLVVDDQGMIRFTSEEIATGAVKPQTSNKAK